ncbi:hypothetical protein D3C76_1414050 [compost metagenome]
MSAPFRLRHQASLPESRIASLWGFSRVSLWRQSAHNSPTSSAGSSSARSISSSRVEDLPSSMRKKLSASASCGLNSGLATTCCNSSWRTSAIFMAALPMRLTTRTWSGNWPSRDSHRVPRPLPALPERKMKG